VDPQRHLDALKADSAALHEAAGRGLDRPVPGCPGWDVARLVEHIGRVHWVISTLVRTRSLDSEPTGWPPTPEGRQRLDWLAGLSYALVEALSNVDPETPLWTWAGGVRTARFWFRRAAQETAMHRWDAQSAIGDPSPVDPRLAADGIDELLEIFLPYWEGGIRFDGVSGSLFIRCHDTPASWLVRIAPDGAMTTPQPASDHADCALDGTASDLLLLLWGRGDGGVHIRGDRSLLDGWRASVRI
jgi:uncharacterized protein (TIGR03083 family)